jgi:hypothetical protein
MFLNFCKLASYEPSRLQNTSVDQWNDLVLKRADVTVVPGECLVCLQLHFFMCVFVCIYIRVCTHVLTCMCLCVRYYLSMCNVFMDACMRFVMHRILKAFTHACALYHTKYRQPACIHVCMYVRICTYPHIYEFMYVHIHVLLRLA